MINLQGYIGFALGVLVSLFIGSVYISGLKIAHRIELEDQKKAIEKVYKDQAEKIEGVNDEYYRKNANLNKLVDNLNRVHNNRCVTVTNIPSGNTRADTGSFNAGQSNVTYQSLIEYGGQCEQLRLRLISIKDWAND